MITELPSAKNTTNTLLESLGTENLPKFLKLLVSGPKSILEEAADPTACTIPEVSKADLVEVCRDAGVKNRSLALEWWDSLAKFPDSQVLLIRVVSPVVGYIGTTLRWSDKDRCQCLLREICGSIIIEDRFSPYDVFNILGGKSLCSLMGEQLKQLDTSRSVEERMVASMEAIRVVNTEEFESYFPGLFQTSKEATTSVKDHSIDIEIDDPKQKQSSVHDKANDVKEMETANGKADESSAVKTRFEMGKNALFVTRICFSLCLLTVEVAIALELSSLSGLSLTVAFLIVAAFNAFAGFAIIVTVRLCCTSKWKQPAPLESEDDSTRNKHATQRVSAKPTSQQGQPKARRRSSSSRARRDPAELDGTEVIKDIISQGVNQDRTSVRIACTGNVYVRQQEVSNKPPKWFLRWAVLQTNASLTLYKTSAAEGKLARADSVRSTDSLKHSRSKERCERRAAMFVVDIVQLSSAIPASDAHPVLYCFKIMTQKQDTLLLGCETTQERISWVAKGVEAIRSAKSRGIVPDRFFQAKDHSHTRHQASTPIKGPNAPPVWSSPASDAPLPPPPAIPGVDQRTSSEGEQDQRGVRAGRSALDASQRGSIESNATFFQLSEVSDEEQEPADGTGTTGQELVSRQQERVDKAFDDLFASLQ